MKECSCNECEGYQEGFCIMEVYYPGFDSNACNAKSNGDLLIEEEFEELKKFLRET